ncbi:hypothetical protein CDL15_Pgr010281 [Punica granatum]|uniref:Uncharacterized protein n=1 Tax=Punica granatum TaxID=22663 RepID=A0A218W2U8_PUNGR|nr:hypothetical protein CDL15_Pgr010281 [Punica granatum]
MVAAGSPLGRLKEAANKHVSLGRASLTTEISRNPITSGREPDRPRSWPLPQRPVRGHGVCLASYISIAAPAEPATIMARDGMVAAVAEGDHDGHCCGWGSGERRRWLGFSGGEALRVSQVSGGVG